MRCLRDEPEKTEEEGPVILGRRIWKGLRDLGLGLEAERCQGEATAQKGSGQPEREGSEKERGLGLVRWPSG